MDAVLAWLERAPAGVLYTTLALAAFAESIAPILPTDVIVAFGGVVAARGDGTPLGTFLSSWLGSIAGAMSVYRAGLHWGAEALAKRLEHRGGHGALRRLQRQYASRGYTALFVARFLPGIRAAVPPVAGAMRLSATRVLFVIAVAAAIWYGAITALAVRLAHDWDRIAAIIGAAGRWAALAAVIIAALATAWYLRRRHR